MAFQLLLITVAEFKEDFQFKPVSTIKKKQNTVNNDGDQIKLSGKGRHDPCVLPRAVPIVEAMVALVIADHSLRQRTSRI